MALIVLAWIARIFLGGLFIVAGYTKAANPFLFEMAVDAYQILPPTGVVIVARTLPWCEVLLGALLLSGWKLRYFSVFAAALMTFFVGTMAYTYSRGVEANCGCFGFGEKISPQTLARDTGFLAIAIFLAIHAWRTHRAKLASNGGSRPPAVAEQV